MDPANGLNTEETVDSWLAGREQHEADLKKLVAKGYSESKAERILSEIEEKNLDREQKADYERTSQELKELEREVTEPGAEPAPVAPDMSYSEFQEWSKGKPPSEVEKAMSRVKWGSNNQAGQALQSKDGFSPLTMENENEE